MEGETSSPQPNFMDKAFETAPDAGQKSNIIVINQDEETK